MNDPAAIERGVRARYQVLVIIWAAQVAALVAFFLLAALVFERKEAGDATLFWILTGASVALVVLSFLVKQKLFAQAIEKLSPALVQQGQIVALALCEAAALFGLTARVVTGQPLFYLPFIVAGLGMLLHFPRREPLAAASFRNRI